MNERKLIVLTLDGLATSALSCYGSSWNSTPAIDTLASVGCVWERCITPSDDPKQVFQRWMQRNSDDGKHWLDPWRELGRTELITDDRHAIDVAQGAAFDRSNFVSEIELAVDEPTDRIDQTQLGQVVATAIDRGCQPDPWSVLWLHSQFLTKRWDAPRLVDEDVSNQSTEPNDEVELLGVAEIDEEDPLPLVFDQLDPPQVMVENASHPDLITSWMTTYGCQVRLIDDLIAVMLEALDVPDAIVVVAGTSGFSLGQNGWIGHRVGPLRSCHTRLPLIVGCQGPLRSLQLSSTDCLFGLLHKLADNSQPLLSAQQWTKQDDQFQPKLITRGDGEVGITTPGWFLVHDNSEEQALFLKPDDVEDANDIHRLRADVVSQLNES